MFSMVVGHSEDIEGAAAEIIDQCRDKLAGRPAKAALLLASIDVVHQSLLDAIHEAWPGIALIGGTTDGEMSSVLGFVEDSVTLSVFTCDDSVEIVTAVGRNLSADIDTACSVAVTAAKAKTSLPLRLCLTIPESLTANCVATVSALTAMLGAEVPVLGGTCGDRSKFKATRQFFGSEVLSDSVPVMLFSGDLACSFGVASGWTPISEPGTITSATGALVHTINGGSALGFYQKHMGSGEKPNSEFPLAILNAEGCIEYLRTTTGTVDDATGAVTFFGDVPEGARVRISTADRLAIIKGCEASIRSAQDWFPEDRQRDGVLVFSCAARKFLLGTRTVEESKCIGLLLGDIPYVGFYSYGEIAPNSGTSSSRFHNESFVTVLLGS